MIVAATLALASCEPNSLKHSDQGGSAPPAPEWRAAPEPVLKLSAVATGSDSLVLYGMGHAVFTKAGHVAVTVEGGDVHQLAIVDLSGQLVATAGGHGWGPRQFRDLTTLFRIQDGLAVWDRLSRRVTVYSENGTELREAAAVPVPSAYQVVGSIGPRTIVATPAHGRARRGDVRFYDVWNFSGERTSRLAGPLESEDGVIVFEVTYGDERKPFRQITSLTPFCLPAIQEVTMDRKLYVVDGGRGTVSVFDSGFRPTTIYRSYGSEIVTRSMVEAARSELESVRSSLQNPIPGPTGYIRLSDVRFPDEAIDSVLTLVGAVGEPLRSHWDKVLSDGQERLWLRRAFCREERENRVWDVVDATGELIATAITPASAEVKAVSPDHVAAVLLDEWDVEHLAVFHIEKGRR